MGMASEKESEIYGAKYQPDRRRFKWKNELEKYKISNYIMMIEKFKKNYIIKLLQTKLITQKNLSFAFFLW